MAGNIFINYRHSDDPGSVHAIYLSLEKKFGSSAIFKDVEGDIKAGYDYDKVLKEKLNDCDVMLVIIGPDWLSEENRERLHDPEDWVRLEIEHGLNTGKRVIPLIIGKTSAMPDAMELPAELSPLAYKQNILIDHMKFSADIEHLIEQITEAFKETEKDKKQRLKQEKAAAAEAARQALEKERKERKQYFSLFLSKLSFLHKAYLVGSFVIINLSLLNLFAGVGGFQWSTVFGNVIMAYETVFHGALDWLSSHIFRWLFGWIDFTFPKTIKDVIVLLSILVFGERIAIREDKKRYADTISFRKKAHRSIYVEAVIFSLFFAAFGLVIYLLDVFLKFLSIRDGLRESLVVLAAIAILVISIIFERRSIKEREMRVEAKIRKQSESFQRARNLYSLMIVFFAFIFMGLNFTFLKLGL